MPSAGVIQKIKELIKIEEDIPIDQLSDLLWQYRNQHHPDRTIDENEKEQAGEKFKEASNLLEQLKQHIETIGIKQQTRDLVPWEHSYNSISDRLTIIRLDGEIQKLNMKNQELMDQNERLEKILNELRDNEIKKKTKEVMDQFKVSPKKTITLSIVALLSIALTIFAKVEEISRLFLKYSPINNIPLNIIMIWIFSFTILVLLLGYTKTKIIMILTERVCSRPYISGFINYLQEEKKALHNFNEEDIYRYIYNSLNKGLLKITISLLFIFEKESMFTSIMNLYIYTLLSKRLIEPAGQRDMTKIFRVVTIYV